MADNVVFLEPGDERAQKIAKAMGSQTASDILQILGEGPRSLTDITERLNIPIRVYPLQTEPNTLVCDADPVNTVYINHRGEVTPCVYLGLTLQGQVPRYYHGEARPFDTLSFGNVRDGLPQVLQGRERNKFTEPLKRRSASAGPLALFSYMTEQNGGDGLPNPPAACQSSPAGKSCGRIPSPRAKRSPSPTPPAPTNALRADRSSRTWRLCWITLACC